jgi:hypothetical protein
MKHLIKKLLFATAMMVALVGTATAEITDNDRGNAMIIMYSEQCGYVEPKLLEYAKQGRPYEMRAVRIEYDRWMNRLRARGMNEAKVKTALCDGLESFITEMNAFEICMNLVDKERLINDLDKVTDECSVVAKTKTR